MNHVMINSNLISTLIFILLSMPSNRCLNHNNRKARRQEEPKRRKFKSAQNYAITSPTPPTNPKFTYTTQQTQPKQTRKEYTGPHPLCANCTFHHSPTTGCRLCTKCNRLGHFATNCRSNLLPTNTVTQAPRTATTRACNECGDPNHMKNTCPKRQPATTPTVPTPQQNQAPRVL